MSKMKFEYRLITEPSRKRQVNNVPIGKVFEWWTVLDIGVKPDYLLCRCKCGLEREVHVYSLTIGKSKSCGCKRKAGLKVVK